MAQPSGLSGQIGLKAESTYGTPVTVDRFFPLVSESLAGEVERIESAAIIAGNTMLTSEQWTPGLVTVGGDTGFELTDRSCGILFKAMFGAVSTSGSGPYTHTFTRGTLGSHTINVGRPATDGTVHPACYTGSKVASWELACKVGEIATLGLTWMCQNEQIGSRTVTDGVTTNSSKAISSSTAAFTQADVGKIISGTGIAANTTIAAVTSSTAATLSANATATGTGITFTIGQALPSASYASGALPLKFTGAALTIAGADMYASEVIVKGENGLSDARPYLGSALTREHLPADLRSYTADIKAEFDSLTSWTAFRAGTEATLSLAFTLGSYSVTLAGNVRYDKAATNVAGKGILEKDCTVKFADNSSTSISVVLVNGDSTP